MAYYNASQHRQADAEYDPMVNWRLPGQHQSDESSTATDDNNNHHRQRTKRTKRARFGKYDSQPDLPVTTIKSEPVDCAVAAPISVVESPASHSIATSTADLPPPPPELKPHERLEAGKRKLDSIAASQQQGNDSQQQQSSSDVKTSFHSSVKTERRVANVPKVTQQKREPLPLVGSRAPPMQRRLQVIKLIDELTSGCAIDEETMALGFEDLLIERAKEVEYAIAAKANSVIAYKHRVAQELLRFGDDAMILLAGFFCYWVWPIPYGCRY